MKVLFSILLFVCLLQAREASKDIISKLTSNTKSNTKLYKKSSKYINSTNKLAKEEIFSEMVKSFRAYLKILEREK